MSAGLLVALLVTGLVIASQAAAQDAASRKADGVTLRSDDYDADYLGLKGVMVDRIATRDTDDFARDTTRVGTSLHYASPYDFVAVGVSRNEFRQHDWSTAVNSLLLTGRNVDRRTAAGWSGRLAVTTNTPKAQIHGEGSWNVRLTESTGVELVLSRDAVESLEALQRGLLYSFLAVSVDYAPTERLTLVAMPTYQHYSDGNTLTGWRGRAIYSLLPDDGLSLELSTRSFDSSESGDRGYFNPAHYSRTEIGLRWRYSFDDWRVLARAGAGQEKIDHGAVENPTHYASLLARRSFVGNAVLGGELNYYRASDAASAKGNFEDYAWWMGRIYLSVPF